MSNKVKGIPLSVRYIDRYTSEMDEEVSSASSSSQDGRDKKERKTPYRDEEEEEEETRENSIGDTHTYPPKGLKQDYNGRDDDLLEEEELVGLMQKDRGRPKVKKDRPILLTRCLVALGVVASILLLAPLLGWLASNPPRSEHLTYMEQVKASPDWELPSDFFEKQLAIDSEYRKTRPAKNRHPLPPGVTKLPKASNDAGGAYALGTKGPFAFDFTVPGWTDGDYTGNMTLKRITMDSVFDRTFVANNEDLAWSAEDRDEGVFVTSNALGDIVLEDVSQLRKDKTGQGEVASVGGKVTLVSRNDVLKDDGTPLVWDNFQISSDMQFVLFFTERDQQWRHSSISKLWLYDIKAKETHQIGHNTTGSHILTASWSPKPAKRAPSIAFVEDNNLFVIMDPSRPNDIFTITSDGSPTVFNAVTDWVYEEEVFGGDRAYWWSPDGNRLVYLRFDETTVPVYTIPIYNPSDKAGKVAAYNKETEVRYPKPGFPNPIVDAYVVDLIMMGGTTNSTRAELVSPFAKVGSDSKDIDGTVADFALHSAGETNRIISEVLWVNNTNVLIRETNRISDAMRVIYFDVTNVTMTEPKSKDEPGEPYVLGHVGRRHSTVQTGGWIPPSQEKIALHADGSSSNPYTAYLDLIDPPGGFRHLAYYSGANASHPLFLTEGDWEIDKVVHVDVKRGKAYFLAAYPHPSQRHLFSVDIPRSPLEAKKGAMTAMTDVKKPGYYDVTFDPKGSYYVVKYKGPDIPHTRLKSVSDPTFDLELGNNEALRETVSKYIRPSRVFYNVTTKEGIEVSVEELRPHDFDASGNVQYPVLFNVYGGPNSQVVKAEWKMNDWHTFLACTLGYVVVKMDGRGTGFKGRRFRDPVTWTLGHFESMDVVDTAQAIRRLPYVAESKIGIWGWSYGGYLTSKVLERDSGAFDLGMAVAPVAKWTLYDSIYTERYLKTPRLNAEGYRNSTVHITDGFKHAHYLLAQGSGDDNVHFSNSAQLLDLLTEAKVRDFWFRMFTDSAHSISKRGAYRELYEYLTRFLVAKWGTGPHRSLQYG